MFKKIAFLLCVCCLWSSIEAVPYHEVGYELENSSDRYQYNATLRSTATENKAIYDELYNEYNEYDDYDTALKTPNMSSDKPVYDDTTEHYMTTTSTEVPVGNTNSTWSTTIWEYNELYADALIYLVIFILLVYFIIFLWKIGHLGEKF